MKFATLPAPRWVVICILFIVFVIFLNHNIHRVQAEITTCTASVSPTYLTPSSSGTVTFTVENNGPDDAIWLEFDSPSSSLISSAASADGWSVSNSGDQIIFTGGSLAAGNEGTFSITLSSGSETMSAQAWTVKINDTESSTGATTCGGSPSIAISGEAPATLDITNVTLSGVTSTTATIAFTTGVSATSSLQYGTSTDYDSNDAITTATTSHSYTISGLTANTVYHYQLQAQSGDNTVETEDLTFNTAAVGAGTTTTVTVTTNTTTTSTVTRTITPTPTPDKKPPVVTLEAVTKEPSKTPPVIAGSAVDNDTVSSLEYTVDAGKTWNKITNPTGLSSSVANFRFTPQVTADGITKLKVRAKDASTNVGTSTEVSFTIDQNGPTLSLTTSFSQPFTQAPLISGVASDPSGEASVQYSLDGGSNWQPVDQTSIKSSTETGFTVTPPPLDDGNYPLAFRAQDPLGNTGPILTTTLIIDRLPPRIGTTMIIIGPQELVPEADGSIHTLSNIYHTISTSVVGGPTEVTLTLKSPTTTITTPLYRQRNTNLWTGNISLPSVESYTAALFARDGANNTAEKHLTPLVVSQPGKLTTKPQKTIAGTITVFVQDKTTGTYLPWDAASYGQQNPQRTTPTSPWGVLLPPGTYYLQMTARGYETMQTSFFTLEHTTPLSPTFTLSAIPTITVLGMPLSLPHFRRTYIEYDPEHTQYPKAALPPFSFPNVNLETNDTRLSGTSLLGKYTLLTILNTYSPQSLAQIAVLNTWKKNNPNDQFLTIIPNQSQSSVTLFAKRGGYSLPIVADPDGTILSQLPITIAPTHFLFDPQGNGILMTTGVLDLNALERLWGSRQMKR